MNAELRNKMNQTSDLIRRLDAGIKTNHMEACNLGEAKRQLVKTRDELAVPLRTTMKRLQLRDQRPHRELVEDPLHMVRARPRLPPPCAPPRLCMYVGTRHLPREQEAYVN